MNLLVQMISCSHHNRQLLGGLVYDMGPITQILGAARAPRALISRRL
jgi:hypothetical protein